MHTINIFSPVPGKGINKDHTANDVIEDEGDYIELGLIVRDENGVPISDKKVNVTAVDKDGNVVKKEMKDTGTVRKLNIEGAKVPTLFYPFHYEFKTVGKHTITFECEGVTDKVELKVKKRKKT